MSWVWVYVLCTYVVTVASSEQGPPHGTPDCPEARERRSDWLSPHKCGPLQRTPQRASKCAKVEVEVEEWVCVKGMVRVSRMGCSFYIQESSLIPGLALAQSI